MSSGQSLPRPRRWDIPYAMEREGGQPMTDKQVDLLLGVKPFSDLDPAGFRRTVSLRGILKNDCRFLRCREGDIIVREGDWGNSAFFILKGSVRVVIEPPEASLPPRTLGRGVRKRRSLFRAISQLWRNNTIPEVRTTMQTGTAGVGARGVGQATRLYLQDVPAVLDKYRTVRLTSGQLFGELAALGRTARSASVFADGKATLLEIRWQGLRDIIRFDKNGKLRQYVEDVFRERALKAFLSQIPLFQQLDPAEMEDVVEQTQFATYGIYDSAKSFKDLAKDQSYGDVEQEPLIAREGDPVQGVVLIRSGLARVSQRLHHGHRTVSYLNPGHVYGFSEVAQQWQTKSSVPLKYSLRAIGFTNVVTVSSSVIEKYVLEMRRRAESLLQGPSHRHAPVTVKTTSLNLRLLGRRRTLERPTAKRDEERGKAVKRAAETAVRPDAEFHITEEQLNFLVDGRYVQGTATMVIDLDRCTRCDDCVAACATTHDNNPRFVRHGPVHNNHMIVNACLHCADPVCMIECPTGAIHRNLQEGLIDINERTCIGCAACANNCPFDAIRMVEIRDPKGRLIVDEATQSPLMHATKCDLCKDQLGGPACERACPHDALVRLDMHDSEALGEFLNR